MKTFEIRTKRDQEKQTVDVVYIDFGTTRFRLNMDVTGGLRINKIDKSADDNSTLIINPCVGNEIIIK